MMKFNKPILMLDEIVYPSNLFKFLKNTQKSKFPIGEFGKDCIRLIVMCDNEKERLNSATKQITESFLKMCNIHLLYIDEEDLNLTIENVIKQIENGIDEKAFYDWFMPLTFQFSQINLPLEEDSSNIKKDYLPCIRPVTYQWNNGLYSTYLFFCSNGSLANPLTLGELIKKADKAIQLKVNKSPTKLKKRDPIEARLRHEVFKRDSYKCIECGKGKEQTTLHCDHIIPVSRGGTDELSNLQTLCEACNLAKSDKIINEVKNGASREPAT